MDHTKEQIISKIDKRLGLLRQHSAAPIHGTGNQFEDLNQALGRVIGGALTGELEDLRTFVQGL